MTPIRLLVTETKDGDWRAEVRMGTPSEPFSACTIIWGGDRSGTIAQAVDNWRRARQNLRDNPNGETP